MAERLPITKMPDELFREHLRIIHLSEGMEAFCEPDALFITKDREVYLYIVAKCVMQSDIPILPGERSIFSMRYRWTVKVQCLMPGRSYRVDITRAARMGHKWEPATELNGTEWQAAQATPGLYLPVYDLIIDSGEMN